jgi:hypothetical protein
MHIFIMTRGGYVALCLGLISAVQSFNIDNLNLPPLSDTFGVEADLNGDASGSILSSSQSLSPPPDVVGKKKSKPNRGTNKRRTFPQTKPSVCLAFLSCCNRTDLLWKTMSAAVKHMEEDEPDVPYELAWLDNGSEGAKNVDSSEVEHVKLLESNMGLAWGLNSLFFDMCTAPYVLILEEDWLYMDATVANPTYERKHAVGRALEVAKETTRSFDGRQILGAFLRPETYHTFLKPPYVGPWQRTKNGVEYKLYCADVSGGSGYLWGSFTNGVN